MNMKFGIGVVVAIVMQVSAFVWWTAQQAQTISTLKNEVSELTAKAEIEKQVQLASEVKQLRKEIDKIKEDIIESLTSIDNARISEDSRLGNHIDARIDSLIADLQAEFAKHEGWIDELDVDVDDIYAYIADELQKLDKKLSDRINKGE